MTAAVGERVRELLADRASVGLGDAKRTELESLLAQHPKWVALDDDSFELAAAAAALAMAGRGRPMPPALRRRVIDDGVEWFRRREGHRVRWVAWTGWAVAAACLLLTLFLRALDGPPGATLPSQLRGELVTQAGDAVTLGWQSSADPLAAGASGDVVWSASRQEGYMRFRGLAANDSSLFQYQLWIFDSARNSDYPVDGGVFDIPVDGEEWIVPIRARLPVSQATLFAVTVEAPGGVVVSSRERIALIAQPQG